MQYNAFSHSSLGPQYKKKNWECQDSSDNWEIANSDGLKVIAIADGHGSVDCFRSNIGSKLAIEATKKIIDFLYKEKTPSDPITLDNEKINVIKFNLCELWRHLVKEHWDDSKPIKDDFRYNTVSEKYKKRYGSENQTVVEEYLYNAYGTTLLAAMDLGSKILLLQIGDGTCVTLNQKGRFDTPIPIDESNYINVTSSLCEHEANKKIYYKIIDCEREENKPVAIFLSSDGIDKCYPIHENEKHLFKLYTTIINAIITEGYENTTEDLKTKFLQRMTRTGSQDDISLAFLLCNDIEKLKNINSIINKTKHNEKTSEEIEESIVNTPEKTIEIKKEKIFGDFQYVIENDYIKITKYVGQASEIEIPKEIENLPTKIITEQTFFYNKTIKKIKLPSTIKKVENFAFYSCSVLEEVSLSKTLINIDKKMAFFDCQKLKIKEY